MDLNSIENLNEKQILDLYQDVMETGSNVISYEACWRGCSCGCLYNGPYVSDCAPCK